MSEPFEAVRHTSVSSSCCRPDPRCSPSRVSEVRESRPGPRRVWAPAAHRGTLRPSGLGFEKLCSGINTRHRSRTCTQNSSGWDSAGSHLRGSSWSRDPLMEAPLRLLLYYGPPLLRGDAIKEKPGPKVPQETFESQRKKRKKRKLSIYLKEM